MPGIVTHNKILKESIFFLQKKKKKNYLLRSIQALFSSPEYVRAALFGAIGPNIFDYIPKRSNKVLYGNEISFFFHNGESNRFVASMLKIINSYTDKNNEWSSLQRAYLYGFISHLIADAIIHPFLFYFSGFPDSGNKEEILYYREQNLLYQYTIDHYILQHREDSKNFQFSVQEMLPVTKGATFRPLILPIKAIIIEAIHNEFPEIYKKITWRDARNNGGIDLQKNFGYLDIIPYLLALTYKLKMTRNQKLRDLIVNIRSKNYFYSDFIVLYPQLRSIDPHILNYYRARWHYPIGPTSIHYESFENLLQIACEKTVEAWELIESSLYEKKEPQIMDLLSYNAFTGTRDHHYLEMKQKNPIRIRY